MMGQSPVETVRRFADQIGEMKREGETWDRIAAMIETETGETLSVPVLRATYSRIGKRPLKAETPKLQTLQKSALEPQILAVQSVQKSATMPPSDHLIRLVGHQSSLEGWTDFILCGEALDRLKKRRPNFDFDRLENLQPDTPISHLLTGWSLREFGRFQAEKIDVSKFRKLDQIGEVGQEVRAVEERVLNHFKLDRHALFCAMAEEFFRTEEAGFAAWVLRAEGLAYYNSLQFLDSEITAGRSDHLLSRCKRWTENVHRLHIERGWAKVT